MKCCGYFVFAGPLLSRLAKELVQCDLSKLYFMRSAVMQVLGVDGCRVSRCGYTGEDGIEVNIRIFLT